MLLPFHSNPDFQASLPGLSRDQIVWGEGGGLNSKITTKCAIFRLFFVLSFVWGGLNPLPPTLHQTLSLLSTYKLNINEVIIKA